MTGDRAAGRRRESPEATFAPQKLEGGGRPGTMLGWLGILVVMIGVAILGPRATARPASAPLDAAALATVASHPESQLAQPGLGAGRGVVVLTSPRRGVDVTSERLAVEGFLRIEAAAVRLSLEVRHEKVSQTVLIDLADPDGGIRPDRRPTFRHEFELPFIRPAGEMTLQVIAYGADGVPIAGGRYPVQIGPVLAIPEPRGP